MIKSDNLSKISLLVFSSTGIISAFRISSQNVNGAILLLIMAIISLGIIELIKIRNVLEDLE